ncbi:MAG: hypothetical protein RIB60_07135 [Phycisphaerales bacterium]
MTGVPSRRGRRLMCGAVIGALAGSAYAQTDFFWASPVDDTWSNSGAWSPAGGPGANDNAIFDVIGKTGYTCTLDVTNATVLNFSLTANVATFNLNDNGFGVSADLSLSNGAIRGNSNQAGALLVGGSANMSNATVRDMNQFAVVGDAVGTNMLFQNIAQWDVGPQGSLTLTASELVGIGELNNLGELTLDTGGGDMFASIDDTCVGNGKNMNWTGAGTVAVTNGGMVMNNEGGTFAIRDGGGTMSGDSKTPASFVNDGVVTQELTGRFGNRGALTTTFSQLDFVNNGTVAVGFGEMLFTNSTGVTDDNALQLGTWRVRGGSTLTFENQQIDSIIGGAAVEIFGEFSTFNGIEALDEIGQGSSFRIGGGYDFVTNEAFTNNGLLRVDQDSLFAIQEFGLTNLQSGVLMGGTYQIEGQLQLLPGDQIPFLEADVTLIGADSQLTGIEELIVVGSQGRFALEDGREFQTVDDFNVVDGGRVRVGMNSSLVVNGVLGNFQSGIFEDAFFEIEGTLQAPNLMINTISNELILDGVGSLFIDGQGNDALGALQLIAEDGILRLRGGRTLQNLNSLIVDGILEIDPASGRILRGDDGLAGLSTVGDFRAEAGSEIILGLAGTEPDNFGSIGIGGDGFLAPSAALTLVFNGSYDPKAGDEFVLVLADGSVFGEFGSLNVRGLRDGLAVELTYLSNAVLATVTPTPASAALLAMGGLVASRRRR